MQVTFDLNTDALDEHKIREKLAEVKSIEGLIRSKLSSINDSSFLRMKAEFEQRMAAQPDNY